MSNQDSTIKQEIILDTTKGQKDARDYTAELKQLEEQLKRVQREATKATNAANKLPNSKVNPVVQSRKDAATADAVAKNREAEALTQRLSKLKATEIANINKQEQQAQRLSLINMKESDKVELAQAKAASMERISVATNEANEIIRIAEATAMKKSAIFQRQQQISRANTEYINARAANPGSPFAQDKANALRQVYQSAALDPKITPRQALRFNDSAARVGATVLGTDRVGRTSSFRLLDRERKGIEKSLLGMESEWKKIASTAPKDAADFTAKMTRAAELQAEYVATQVKMAAKVKQMQTASAANVASGYHGIGNVPPTVPPILPMVGGSGDPFNDPGGAWASGLRARNRLSLANRFVGAGETGSRVGQAMTWGMTAPIAAVNYFTAKAAMDDEAQFARVRRFGSVAEGKKSAGQVEKDLHRGLRDIGTKDGIPVALKELYAIAEEGGLQQIEGSALLPFTKTIAKMSAITKMSPESLGNDSGRIIANTYNENVPASERNISPNQKVVRDINTFGSVVVGLDTVVKGKSQDIIKMALNLSEATGAFKMSFQDVLGISARIVDAGPKAEKGASALIRGLSLFSKNLGSTGNLNSQTKSLLSIMGLTPDAAGRTQAKSQFSASPIKFIQKFMDTVSKQKQYESSALFQAVGLEGGRNLQVFAAGAGNAQAKSINQTVKSQSANPDAIDKQAGIIFGTAESQAKILANVSNELGITVGQGFTKNIKELMVAGVSFIEFLGNLAEKMNNLSPGMRGFIFYSGLMLAAMGPLALGIGKVAGAIGSLMRFNAMMTEARGIKDALSLLANQASGTGDALGRTGVALKTTAGAANMFPPAMAAATTSMTLAGDGAMVATGKVSALSAALSSLKAFALSPIGIAITIAAVAAYAGAKASIAHSESVIKENEKAANPKQAISEIDAEIGRIRESDSKLGTITVRKGDTLSGEQLRRQKLKDSNSARLAQLWLARERWVNQDSDMQRNADQQRLRGQTDANTESRWETSASSAFNGAPGADPNRKITLDAFLAGMREVGSGGNYQAKGGGAYKYSKSAWGGYGGYSEAHLAPKEIQDERAKKDALKNYREHNGNLSEMLAGNKDREKILKAAGGVGGDGRDASGNIRLFSDRTEDENKIQRDPLEAALMNAQSQVGITNNQIDSIYLKGKQKKLTDSQVEQQVTALITRKSDELMAADAATLELESQKGINKTDDRLNPAQMKALPLSLRTKRETEQLNDAEKLNAYMSATRGRIFDSLKARLEIEKKGLEASKLELQSRLGLALSVDEAHALRVQILAKEKDIAEKDFEIEAHRIKLIADPEERMLATKAFGKQRSAYYESYDAKVKGEDRDTGKEIQGQTDRIGDSAAYQDRTEQDKLNREIEKAQRKLDLHHQSVQEESLTNRLSAEEYKIANNNRKALGKDEASLLFNKQRMNDETNSMLASDPNQVYDALEASQATEYQWEESFGNNDPDFLRNMRERQDEALRKAGLDSAMYKNRKSVESGNLKGNYKDWLGLAVSDEEKAAMIGGRSGDLASAAENSYLRKGSLDSDYLRSVLAEQGVAMQDATATGNPSLQNQVSGDMERTLSSLLAHETERIEKLSGGEGAKFKATRDLAEFMRNIPEWQKLPEYLRKNFEDALKNAVLNARNNQPLYRAARESQDQIVGGFGSATEGLGSALLGNMNGKKSKQKQAIRSYMDQVMGVATDSVSHVMWDGVLKPQFSRMFDNLKSNLGDIWKGGEKSWASMIAQSASLAMSLTQGGKKGQKGGMFGSLVGLAVGSLVPGLGLMAGASIGGAMGNSMGQGGNFGDALLAGGMTYIGQQGVAHMPTPKSGGIKQNVKMDEANTASRSVQINNVYNGINDKATAEFTSNRTITKLERVIRTGA